VFSVASLASSASDISKGSGYSAVQIAKATQELLSIFQDDEVMQAMYTAAIYGLIGPQKFRNKFRRLLKVFSDNLKDEAQDRLDFLAARLVALKARDIADAIVERYQLSHAPILDAEEEGEGTLSKADDTNLSDEEALTKPDDQDLSDDDEQEETCVDETIFEELTNVRGFLVSFLEKGPTKKLVRANKSDRSRKPGFRPGLTNRLRFRRRNFPNSPR
jgi:hypothetical protein